MLVLIRSATCLSLLLLMPLLSSAQPPAGGQFDREREDVAAGDVPKSSEINLVTRMALSPEQENVLRNPADLATVEKVLKYYLYRLTWEEVQKDRDPTKVGTIGSIMTDLIGNVETNPRLLPRPFSGPPADQDIAQMRNRQFSNVQQMTPMFIKHCKLLLQNKQPIARINAARVLAKLAEWGQEAVVDEFIAIINNPKENDAVRNWAFNGLYEIFSLVGSNDIKAKGLFQSKEGQARFTKALTATYNWLLSATRVPEAKLKFMKPEEQAAIRYVRRAAERVLGAARRPLIVDERATGKQEGPIADLLTKIVSADVSIVPAPDLRERLDTALALCELRGDASPSYQPDYVAEKIAEFLTELGAQANTDKDNKGNAVLAWSLEAHKLKLAIDGFVKQRSAGPATGYLGNFGSKANTLLVFFDNTGVNTDAVKGLTDWLRDNRAPSKEVFKPVGQK